MNINVKVRKVSVEDFNDILLLLHQLWPDKELHEKLLSKAFLDALKSGNNEYFCSEADGKIVGFCSLTIMSTLWQEGYIGYINEMIVDQNFRGQGIGTYLLTTVIEVAKKKDCRAIELASAFHRNEAHGFYEGIGFTKGAYNFTKIL
jgi:glucosamine-phosphate N-acetyltransferase